MPTVTRKNEHLDFAKWVLTLLIVLYHIQVPESAHGITAKACLYLKDLGDPVVPAFALISGFLFFLTVQQFMDVKKKMKRRIHTLLIPYLLWNFINTMVFSLWHNGIANENAYNVNLYNDLFIWNATPHFWYIFMLIFWTVLAPVLYASYKNKCLLFVLCGIECAYIYCMGSDILHSRFIYIVYTWGGNNGHLLA